MMSVVHAGSSGIAICFPDVCLTPILGVPVPIPYPNISKSSDLKKGSKKVKADGEKIAIEGCNFKESMGDSTGSQGGVMSGKTEKKAEFMLYSMDVKIEGKGVCRALDMVLSNKNNTAPGPVLQGPP